MAVYHEAVNQLGTVVIVVVNVQIMNLEEERTEWVVVMSYHLSAEGSKSRRI